MSKKARRKKKYKDLYKLLHRLGRFGHVWRAS